MTRILTAARDFLADALFELFWNTDKTIAALAGTGLYALLSGRPLHHLPAATIAIALLLVLDVTAWHLGMEEYRREEEASS